MTPTSAATAAGTRVFVVDQIVAKPGRARALLEAYRDGYAPGARERGMVLGQIVLAPPVWLTDQSNVILAIWTLDGAEAWWRMSIAARNDPAIEKWWRDAATLIVSRQRFVGSDPSAVAGLCDV